MVAPSHLKSLQALEAALRAGSLKGAADALGITPAAVGQRVKTLEDFLGVDLLTRGRSGLAPTPALAPAVARLEAAFSELEAAAEALDLQRRHEIHLAGPSDFVELWLAPRLAAFRAARPNTLFCVNGEGDAPLRLGSVDCEIRFGPAPTESARDLLFHDFVVPIGSPENVARIATAPVAERLEGFPLLHLDFYRDDPAAPDWSAWVARHGGRRTAPDRGIRFRRIAPALEAVLADAGLTLCGLALIAPLVTEGRVALPFPVATGVLTDHAFTARWRTDALARPQVRGFRAWLAAEAERSRDQLAALVDGGSAAPL